MWCDWMKTELLAGSLAARLAHPAAAVAATELVADAEQGGSVAISHKERENVELLPNVLWQAVARKSGSLGKSLHKDQ